MYYPSFSFLSLVLTTSTFLTLVSGSPVKRWGPLSLHGRHFCPDFESVVASNSQVLRTTFVGANREWCIYSLSLGQAYRGYGKVKMGGGSISKQKIQMHLESSEENITGHGDAASSQSHDWLIYMNQPLERKPLQQTAAFRSQLGKIIYLRDPSPEQRKVCADWMTDNVYEVIADIFPVMVPLVGITEGRDLTRIFGMRDIDFDSVLFSDDLETVYFNYDSLDSWKHASGVIKDIKSRFRHGWVLPRLQKYSFFPIEDQPNKHGVCYSHTRKMLAMAGILVPI